MDGGRKKTVVFRESKFQDWEREYTALINYNLRMMMTRRQIKAAGYGNDGWRKTLSCAIDPGSKAEDIERKLAIDTVTLVSVAKIRGKINSTMRPRRLPR